MRGGAKTWSRALGQAETCQRPLLSGPPSRIPSASLPRVPAFRARCWFILHHAISGCRMPSVRTTVTHPPLITSSGACTQGEIWNLHPKCVFCIQGVILILHPDYFRFQPSCVVRSGSHQCKPRRWSCLSVSLEKVKLVSPGQFSLQSRRIDTANPHLRIGQPD